MKLKLLVSLSLFFLVPTISYSQVSTDKKPEQKVFSKPLAYDSTKTLEEQYKLENQYQFIGLQLLLPPAINPEAGPIVFSKYSSHIELGYERYTIVDILQGNVLEELKQKNVTNLCGYRYKDFNSPLWKEMIIHVVFILKDNNNKDSLNNNPVYWIVSESKITPYSNSNFNSMIVIPYYEKQKQLYQNQNVIKLNDKSKWLCTEVALFKSKNNVNQDSTYDIFCVLKNEKGDQIKLTPPSEKSGESFMTEKRYEWLDHANRNEKEKMLKEESERREKRKEECVKKFGQHNGELIAENKIEAGMTTEMCKVAWGMPWNISKTTTSNLTKEIWFYNWKYNLHFENKKLIRIEN